MSEEEDRPRRQYEDWFSDGKCHILYKMGMLDPEIFFPEKGQSTRGAKAVCLGQDGRPPCRILAMCRDYAVEDERFGIWGGTSERERVTLRRAEKRRKRLANKRVVRRPVAEWPAREA